MLYKIISPTGVFVTKTLDEATVKKLKALNHYTLVPLTVHKRVLEECESCSA